VAFNPIDKEAALPEVIVYIHGVSPVSQGSHHDQYQALHDAIGRQCNGSFPTTFCGVEWGWDPGVDHPRSHQLLNKAEAALGGRAIPAIEAASDFTLNPLRLALGKFRDLLMYNFADMFYYASEDGKNAVRYVVAESIMDYLKPFMDSADNRISLTLIAHSAGSVAAFDFLFYLFYEHRSAREFINPTRVSGGPSKRGATGTDEARKQKTLDELDRLKQMRRDGLFRVRRLFTFGSPITPLAFRSDPVVETLAKEDPLANRLDPKDYGLTTNPAGFDPLPPGPRWVNLWDKDDIIAWPVEPLMIEAGEIVKDVYVDVSDSVEKAHNEYWTDSGFQKEIAKRW
jgi:hypothetical protein